MLSDSVKSLVVAAIDAEIANLQAQREQVSGKFGTQAPVKGKGKGQMSAEGRASISASAKARHAAKRAAKAAAGAPEGHAPEVLASVAPPVVSEPEPAQAPPPVPSEPKLTVAQKRAAAKAAAGS
jgi:hypothetical protein